MSPTAPGRRRGRPPALDHQTIARAVVDIGFPDLTFAAVRTHLGVGESTLYRHAPDRDALVRMTLEHLLTEAELPAPTGPWREVLTTHASALWDLMARHPGSAGEAVRSGPPPAMTALFARLAAALVAQGFTPDDAVLACDLVLDLVTDHRRGVEQRPPARAPLAGHPPPDADPAPPFPDVEVLRALGAAMTGDPRAWFDRKLAVVLDGVASSLAPPPRGAPGN